MFASNDYDNCGNAEGHNILSSGIGDEFANGKAFENMRYFYCYGIKTSQPVNTYVSVKQLQFEAEGNPIHPSRDYIFSHLCSNIAKFAI